MNFAENLIREVKKALDRQKSWINRDNFERFIPEAVKSDVIVKKKTRKRFPVLAIVIGAAAAVLGLGAAKVIYDRTRKKVVVLVGDGEKVTLSAAGFKGYALRYSTIDELDIVLDRLCEEGMEEVVVVPMTVLNGYEVESIKSIADYKSVQFNEIKVVSALMSSDYDYDYIAATLIACTGGVDEDTAVVYVGNGTTHFSNSSYIALAERLRYFDSRNIFVGTLSAYPSFEKVFEEVENYGYQKVILCPLEINLSEEYVDALCGDNDYSWLTMFNEAGIDTECYLKGLCSYKGIRKLIVEHTKTAIEV